MPAGVHLGHLLEGQGGRLEQQCGGAEGGDSRQSAQWEAEGRHCTTQRFPPSMLLARPAGPTVPGSAENRSCPGKNLNNLPAHAHTMLYTPTLTSPTKLDNELVQRQLAANTTHPPHQRRQTSQPPHHTLMTKSFRDSLPPSAAARFSLSCARSLDSASTRMLRQGGGGGRDGAGLVGEGERDGESGREREEQEGDRMMGAPRVWGYWPSTCHPARLHAAPTTAPGQSVLLFCLQR